MTVKAQRGRRRYIAFDVSPGTTAESLALNRISEGQEVIIIIGEHLNKQKLDPYFSKWNKREE